VEVYPYKSNYQNTKLRYGNSGNSFVCAVSLDLKLKLNPLLAGGNSGDPLSKHFNDQSEMYQKDSLKTYYSIKKK
jgi:acyl-homoserine lactone acylase PvdQ